MFLIGLLESTYEKSSFSISRGWILSMSLHQPPPPQTLELEFKCWSRKTMLPLNFKQTFYKYWTAAVPGIVTTKVLWQIKTLMSSLVSCLLMSANNQKDDILLQRKRIKQNSKLFLYIFDDFLQPSCFVWQLYICK